MSESIISDVSVASDLRGGFVEPSRWQKMKKGGKEGASRTKILLAGISVVGFLEALNGFGKPDVGDDFADGEADFESYSGMLKLAAPNDSTYWSGAAADNYAAAVKTLVTLAQQMQDADALMKIYVNQQADTVQDTRSKIEYTLGMLGGAIPVALFLYAIPAVGRGVSMAFQTATVLTGVGYASAQVGKTVVASQTVSADVKTVEGTYDSVATSAADVATGATDYKSSDTLSAPKGRAGLGSPSSGFEASSDGESDLSMASTASLGSPPASVGASLGGSSASAESLRSRYSGANSGTSTDDATDTPRFTLNQGPVVALTNEAAAISGNLSQDMNLINQTMGEFQQLASMVPQGHTPAAPAAPVPAEQAAAKTDTAAEAAPEETLADDVQGAGAGSGTEAAGRAPIDAATAGSPQQQPSPGERVL